MGLLGAIGGQIVFFAFSALLMQLALRRRPEGGLFSAFTLGALPALLLFGMEFAALQHRDRPEVQALFAAQTAMAEETTKRFYPGADQAQQRQDMALAMQKLMEVVPALSFIFRMALLAGLAVWLRRRQAKLGLAAAPGPLAHWTASYGFIWLVLGPAFWLLALNKELLQAPPWQVNAASNILAVGVALYLFQGLVVLGAKLMAWSRDPRTRAFTPLVLAAAAISMFYHNGDGFFLVLVLIGLFEPWLDLRRLHEAPPEGGEA